MYSDPGIGSGPGHLRGGAAHLTTPGQPRVIAGDGSGQGRSAVSECAVRYFPVSWEEMHRDSRALSWRLAAHAPWKGIVAIARGGLVPAQIVARELEVR